MVVIAKRHHWFPKCDLESLIFLHFEKGSYDIAQMSGVILIPKGAVGVNANFVYPNITFYMYSNLLAKRCIEKTVLIFFLFRLNFWKLCSWRSNDKTISQLKKNIWIQDNCMRSNAMMKSYTTKNYKYRCWFYQN